MSKTRLAAMSAHMTMLLRMSQRERQNDQKTKAGD